MIVVACPGQGSQTPGFMLPWLELEAYASTIDQLSEASGIDLRLHGTVSDADTIRDTAVAQPLIVGSGVAALKELLEGKSLFAAGIAGVAGHSVGEITAAVAAGIFTAEEGIRFVSHRANAMAKAAALEPTGMAAVLGGEQAVVEARLAELGLEPANYNGGGQIVAAGALDAIAALQAEGPAGARVIPLQVAGAFHTRYMASAVESLAEYAETVTVADPEVTIWTNKDASEVASGNEFVSLLVNQVKSPVRWDLAMQALVNAGVTAVIEVPPAGTLVGMAKRSMPGIELLALKGPEQLDAARELIKNHSN